MIDKALGILNDLLGAEFNTTLSFWCITLLVVTSAVVAAFARNIIHAAYSLFFTLIGMAGYYVLLGSDFLAVTQVVVYVGGILVLLMFGVLLTNRSVEELHSDEKMNHVIAGIAAAVLFFFVLAQIIYSASWGDRIPLTEPMPNTAGIGRGLLSTYVLPFEFSSITLLICLIGAAYMVRRKEE
ncbi:NADH-quinone oxidoreductase subunit J [Candidatus Sumerlaeota bacterium]|nr:NADH-quinone oxidoreductase subunit J [Candidatus Sumerlaeota bacterium]